MNLTCLRPSELCEQNIATWETLQASNACYASPFFSPYFALTVGKARDSARVAIIEDQGQCAFFPFECVAKGQGRALGWGLNDFQGVILPEGMHISARELLVACGLHSWRFDHLVAGDATAQPSALEHRPSPLIDLQEGFDAYCTQRSAAGSEIVKKTRQSERKLVRELGDVRLDIDPRNEEVMSRLALWKTEQLRRAGVTSLFEVEWMRQVIYGLWHLQAEGCRGQLSGLFAGDKLVAAHLGLRSSRVLHWWITAYDPSLGQYSPGGVLLLRLAEAAAADGVRRVDLGKGEEPYKLRFMTRAEPVGEGVLCKSVLAAKRYRALHRLRIMIRKSPVAGPLRYIVRRWNGQQES